MKLKNGGMKMSRKIKKYADVSKTQRNAIFARVKSAVDKYGFDEVRLVAAKFFKDGLDKMRLENEIKQKEDALVLLKKRKNMR